MHWWYCISGFLSWHLCILFAVSDVRITIGLLSSHTPPSGMWARVHALMSLVNLIIYNSLVFRWILLKPVIYFLMHLPLLNDSFFHEQLESPESRKLNNTCLRIAKSFCELVCAPWRFLFAFVPPYQIAHGWVSFILSLCFISGIAYVVTKLTDLISCVTGYMLTALAAFSISIVCPSS